jgi:hypothetical protein
MSAGDQPRPANNQQESPGAKAAGRKRQAVRRIVLPYQVNPGDERRRIVSWFDRLRRDATSGGVGLIASLIVHAIIVVLLGLIAFQTRHAADGDPLLVSWSIPGDTVERTPKSRRPVSIPIEVASITNNRPAEKAIPIASRQDQTLAPVGVAPVDVTQALSSRNPRMRSTNLEHGGGTPDAERAVKAGLGWLARHQASDGHWELHQG